MKYFRFYFLLMALMGQSVLVVAQMSDPALEQGGSKLQNSTDSISKKLLYPNNFKFSLTSNLAFSPSAIFSYERSLKQYQTISLKAGYITFPQIVKTRDPDSIYFESEVKRSGYTFGADYRFYFKKENKFDAPHGLYWGPLLITLLLPINVLFLFRIHHLLQAHSISLENLKFCRQVSTSDISL